MDRRARSPVTLFWLASIALLGGCESAAPAPRTNMDAGASDAAASAPACQPPSEAQPDRLRRLTMIQYQHTVRDLVLWALGDPADAAAVIDQAALSSLPADRLEPVPQDIHGSYRRLDQALEQAHVDAAFRVGSLLSQALTQPKRLAVLAGQCAVDDDASNDAACLDAFVRRFGARALRRPIDDDDLAFYRDVYGDASGASADAAGNGATAAAYADVINVMLNAPEFLYFVEHGAGDASHVAPLTAHELASRLSYHFWETMPDDELWRAAEDGSLLTDAVYRAQVERLSQDIRSHPTMLEFFSDWLKVERLPMLGQNADPVFTAFAGSDLPTPALRDHMIDDVLNMVAYYTWIEPAGFTQLFTSERSFARDQDLAQIYGVAAWDSTSLPPLMPAGERPGLLTRALFLTTGSANTRPIQKGVFLRRTILCDEIPPPPAGVNAMPPELRSDMTTRQVVESLTEQPDSQCAGCHATLINPLGFATEDFDALGRHRSEQTLFDPQGNAVGSLAVDTHSVPRITPGDEHASEGAADLVKMMVDSGKLQSCLARNYFRFTFGRWEDESADACVLERLRAKLTQTDSIAVLLKEVALTPEFRRRTFD